MLVATRFDRGDVRGLAIKVHENERFGGLTRLGFLFDDRAGQRGIHVPADSLRVDEDGLGAKIGNGRGRGDESQRGAQDFVPRSNAGETQRKM